MSCVINSRVPPFHRSIPFFSSKIVRLTRGANLSFLPRKQKDKTKDKIRFFNVENVVNVNRIDHRKNYTYTMTTRVNTRIGDVYLYNI